MTISIAIIAVLIAVDLFLGYMLVYINSKCAKEIASEIEEKQKILQELQEAHNKNLIHSVVELTLLLKINAVNNDYQRFTEAYQQLYFLGIKKEILDNSDSLEKFISKLINQDIDIQIGEKPFYFNFVEKK